MLLKNALIPIGCFGVPLTAGFIVLSASGVVDLQIFPTSSNEDDFANSKRLLQKDEAPLLPMEDDHLEADDAFYESIKIKKENIPALKQEISTVENNEIQKSSTKPRRATRGEIRKLVNKNKSNNLRNKYQHILEIFIKNGKKWQPIGLDIDLLLNQYWLTDEDKNHKISELLNKYSSDIQHFTEREKTIVLNNIQQIIL